jgi:hypothetical protein
MTTTTGLGTKNASIVAPDWDAALCRQTDPDLFFPVGIGGAVAAQNEQAKQVCRQCPVRVACLNFALDTGQTSGVWGGLSEAERRELQGTPRGSQFLLCISEQDLIEQRVADKATYRQIAEELGVGHHAVARALKYFKKERASQTVLATVEGEAA